VNDWEEVMKQELHAVQGLIKEAEEAATKRERERIIALIESSQVGGYTDADYIVALIKGEN
jgi:hypothetical protein